MLTTVVLLLCHEKWSTKAPKMTDMYTEAILMHVLHFQYIDLAKPKSGAPPFLTAGSYSVTQKKRMKKKNFSPEGSNRRVAKPPECQGKMLTTT